MKKVILYSMLASMLFSTMPTQATAASPKARTILFLLATIASSSGSVYCYSKAHTYKNIMKIIEKYGLTEAEEQLKTIGSGVQKLKTKIFYHEIAWRVLTGITVLLSCTTLINGYQWYKSRKPLLSKLDFKTWNENKEESFWFKPMGKFDSGETQYIVAYRDGRFLIGVTNLSNPQGRYYYAPTDLDEFRDELVTQLTGGNPSNHPDFLRWLATESCRGIEDVAQKKQLGYGSVIALRILRQLIHNASKSIGNSRIYGWKGDPTHQRTSSTDHRKTKSRE